jgi:cell division protein ZapE
MTGGPLPAYRALVGAGKVKPDPAQLLAAEKLQSLHHALHGWRPGAGRNGWRERLGLARRRGEAPQGLYLFGAVGRGKSMLMDLFFETAPIAAKRRVHFHSFLLEVHETLHAWRRKEGAVADPLPRLAAEIAAGSWLLCFDEFLVENIADAMILGRLFEGLFEAGVVVVATSNIAPRDLYKDGLQRDRFLPFLDLITRRLDVLELDGPVDYRRDSLEGLTLYHSPLGPAADRALDDAFARLTGGVPAAPRTLHVFGRQLAVPRSVLGVAMFSFAELCERPLGGADYQALARAFHTLVISGVPRLPPARRDEAKRFLILIDTLYEHGVKLVLSAAAPPDSLYPEGVGAAAFQRAVSRILEMQGEAYLAEPLRP